MQKNLLALSLLLALVVSARAEFLIQPNDVLGIAGDSITQQHLYSAFMEDYLLMCQPTPNRKIVQFGWSGERAPGSEAAFNEVIAAGIARHNALYKAAADLVIPIEHTITPES